MSWQDIVISISNIGFIIALIPLFLNTVFNKKTVQVALSITGFITSFFLGLLAVSIFSLGAKVGGSLILLSSVMWFIIAMASWLKSRKKAQ